MHKVEVIRVRDGLSKTALAKELTTTTDALQNWMTGRAIGRKQTVDRIKKFLEERRGRTPRRMRYVSFSTTFSIRSLMNSSAVGWPTIRIRK
jgi:hypothetical protein